jgi:hypothetical protein
MTAPIKARDYPPVGARVRLTHHTKGNAYNGDLRDPDYTVIGRVVESPASRSCWLVVQPPEGHEFPSAPFPIQPDYDVVLPHGVTLHQNALWCWTVEEAALEVRDAEERNPLAEYSTDDLLAEIKRRTQ